MMRIIARLGSAAAIIATAATLIPTRPATSAELSVRFGQTVERTATLQGLRSTDVRGFRTGMTVREVASRIPLRPLGRGDFEAVEGDTKFNFGFTPLGNLYRIDTQQKLGFFRPDRSTARRLTEQLSAKFGPPRHNQLPGGPAMWTTYAQVTADDGTRITREAQSLSVMFQGGHGQEVELWIKLLDFPVLWRDAERLNAFPKAKAEEALRF